GILVRAGLSLLNLSSPKPETTEQKDEQQEPSIHLLMEKPPSKTIVRQTLPKATVELINGNNLLDKDVLFVAGESEMTLTVYKSPLMNAYRKFKKMKKKQMDDGYYVMHKRRIPEENVDSDVVLLYGRGPVFKLDEQEYSDRFEGIDD